jgi:beta-galactosidase/beta-glucuronidase
MSNFVIYSNTSAKILYVKGDIPVEEFSVKNATNEVIDVPLLGRRKDETLFDATNLELWSPDNPVIYQATINNSEKTRFGFTSLKAETNSMLKLNDVPFYARGYIRGIIAHDHPNMTGKTPYDAAVKNICQAKK